MRYETHERSQKTRQKRRYAWSTSTWSYCSERYSPCCVCLRVPWRKPVRKKDRRSMKNMHRQIQRFVGTSGSAERMLSRDIRQTSLGRWSCSNVVRQSYPHGWIANIQQIQTSGRDGKRKQCRYLGLSSIWRTIDRLIPRKRFQAWRCG